MYTYTNKSSKLHHSWKRNNIESALKNKGKVKFICNGRHTTASASQENTLSVQKLFERFLKEPQWNLLTNFVDASG